MRTVTPSAAKSLVTVQRGRGRTPLFIVHGAGGNVLNFRDLARAMSETQPVYGLQAAGVDGVTPVHETIEAMAEAYIAEIRTLQTHNPYLLAGYSGGGIVAFEMARRLSMLGERIGLLAFIDTIHPQMPLTQGTTLSRLGRLRHEGLSYIRGALERSRRRSQQARDEKAIGVLLDAGEPIPIELRELHLLRNFEHAASRYQLQPWNGQATLYRAEQVAHRHQGGGPAYGWDRDVTGGVTIVTVPGDHDTLLLGANARRIAWSMSSLIEQASPGKNPPR